MKGTHLRTPYRKAEKVWRSDDPVSSREYSLGRPSRLNAQTIANLLISDAADPLDKFVVARIRDPKPQYVPSDTVAHDFVVVLHGSRAIGQKPHTPKAHPTFWVADIEQLSPNDIGASSTETKQFSELAISNRGIILAIDGKKDGIYPTGMGYLLSLQAAGKRHV